MMHSQRWLGVALLLTNPATAGETIMLVYNERPPYVETLAGGEVVGLTASPAKQVFLMAGIPFEWKKTSTGAQLLLIRENRQKACLLGWYKNAVREKMGKFTHSIYEDRQTVALGLAGNPRFGAEKSAKELLQNKQALLLVKEGYSYGHVIDDLIARINLKLATAIGENSNMLSMLVYKRADYFFAGEDEAGELIRRSEYSDKDFKALRFANALQEDPRHLWCTRQVPDAVIDKLNAEIDRIRGKR